MFKDGKYILNSNVIEKDTLNKVTQTTLEYLAKVLKSSFGPTGSNTAINKNNIYNQYSKDGRTILNNIKFTGVIEESVLHEIKEITRSVDLKVGDGTTSAVMLSNILFKHHMENSNSGNPYEEIRKLNNVVKLVCDEIMKNYEPFNADKAYDITLVSTNGDKFMAETIKDIYEQYGNSVYVTVHRSNDQYTKRKDINGLVLDSGYSDPSLINTTDGRVILKNSEIYLFQNNIDTREMVDYLRKIIQDNLLEPVNKLNKDPNCGAKIIPTTIIAPSISRDQGPYLEQLLSMINSLPVDNKLPLLLINTNGEKEKMYDIGKICGCKGIQKYIDVEQQKKDMEIGLAPSLDNLKEFAGFAEMVEANTVSTRFINPKLMYADESKTEFHSVYTGLINYLKNEIELSRQENQSAGVIGALRRRLYSLESNLVELYIGGISDTEVDYYKDLVEDAVKNCKSASLSGVGYGANIQGLLAINNIINNCTIVDSDADIEESEDANMYQLTNDELNILNILATCYYELITTLYVNGGVIKDDEDAKIKLIDSIVETKRPIDINTGKFSDNIICSIETDCEILKSVAKIISILYSANQFIALEPALVAIYKTEKDYM